MSWKSRGFDSTPKNNLISRKLTFLLCIGCFCAGMLFTSRMSEPEEKGLFRRATMEDGRQNLIKEDFGGIYGEASKSHHAVQTLDKTISNLEMELAAARATQESMMDGSPVSESESTTKRKYLMVVGVNTAFSREKRKKLEEEKGIIMRFVIGHSATAGGILDKAIEAEDQKHGDFLRLAELNWGWTKTKRTGPTLTIEIKER
ncbi:putative beta-1 3-galactosyltransferase 2 [Bienertia sinuspersici]